MATFKSPGHHKKRMAKPHDVASRLQVLRTGNVPEPFVDTSELIWAVKTTKPGNIKCQYDEKRLISENYIIYNTTFFHGRQRYSIRLRGDFDPEAPNRMLVSTLERSTQYDLRVRDASVTFRLPRSCSRRFHRVAGHGRCIYSSECRQLKKAGK
ncbi:hypothetical protein MRX96_042442 [Rhipicephalus microplus]